MVDPSRCPIPPGFEVIGGFSDDFEHFKEETGYDKPFPHFGFSNRWKNSNLTGRDFVTGFQFRIGPDVGPRWRIILPDHPHGTPTKEFINPSIVDSGDVNIHFPRVDGATGDRGGYIVQIKWYINLDAGQGFITEGKLDKEIPHKHYGEENYFLKRTCNFRSHVNERPKLDQARDGQWHSILGVIFDDYYLGDTVPTLGMTSPTIGLWYSPNATNKFEDFQLLGLSTDNGDMPPRGPLRDPYLGQDDPFKIEHALQIRIDDVPTEEVEIRNVYAANVRYLGAIPPPNPVRCIPEAKVVFDAQDEIEELERQIHELSMDLSDLTGKALEERKSQIDFIRHHLIPIRKSDLSTAKFNYGQCANIGFFRILEPNITTAFGPRLVIDEGTKTITHNFWITTKNLTPPLQIDWFSDRQSPNPIHTLAGTANTSADLTIHCSDVKYKHPKSVSIGIKIIDANSLSATGAGEMQIWARNPDPDPGDLPPICKHKPWLPQCNPPPEPLSDS